MTGQAQGEAEQAAPAAQPGTLRRAAQTVVEDVRVQRFVLIVIVINAVTLGLETSQTAMSVAGPLLIAIDTAALAIFVVEIALKVFAWRLAFFRNGWNVFDFVIVGIGLVPTAEGLTVLRAFRVVRVLRLVSAMPSMRKVVGALLTAIPGMSAIIALLAIVYYVAAVMATKLFGASFPDWFGSIGASAYSLFQIMTLESWSMGIVRPVMEVYPWAWAFFVTFILLTSFTVLNLFIAIIVNAMQAQHDDELRAAETAATDERAQMARDLSALRGDVARLEALMREQAAVRRTASRPGSPPDA